MRTEIPFSLTAEVEKRENCALLGISLQSPTSQVYPLVQDGLLALQHRGDQAVGVSFNDGGVEIYKELGYVSQSLSDKVINNFPESRVVIGHTRYSTVQDKEKKDPTLAKQNSQPFKFRIPYGEGAFFDFSIAHNGAVRDLYPEGLEHGPNSDTYQIGQSIIDGEGTFEERVTETLKKLNGAYMLAFVTSDDRLYLASDLWGFKPGVIGIIDRPEMQGTIFASETRALDAVDARIATYFDRGQFAELTPKGLRNIWTDPRVSTIPRAQCTFEKAYFADAASVLNEDERTNHAIRKALGQRIAERNRKELLKHGDVVAPVPDSGNSYADGVNAILGLPLTHPIQKVRAYGRAFMQNTETLERPKDVKKKYTFIKEEIEGKRLIIVDDSIVRGNTTQRIVGKLFEMGAERITLLSAGLPPLTDPCYWGIDFATPEELIFNQLELQLKTGESLIQTYEKQLALWLVNNDLERSKKIKVIFQKFDDYTSIVQDIAPHIPVKLSGGCFHCVSGIVPPGAETP